jgi:hypothetical protein
MQIQAFDHEYFKFSELPTTDVILSGPKYDRSFWFNLMVIDIQEFSNFLDKLRADLDPPLNLPILIGVLDSDLMFATLDSQTIYNEVFDKGVQPWEVEQNSKDFDLTVEQGIQLLKKNNETFLRLESGLYTLRDQNPDGG